MALLALVIGLAVGGCGGTRNAKDASIETPPTPASVPDGGEFTIEQKHQRAFRGQRPNQIIFPRLEQGLEHFEIPLLIIDEQDVRAVRPRLRPGHWIKGTHRRWWYPQSL